MQTPFWSVEEVTRLRDMLDANKSTAEIALRLNRSTNAVRNKAKQLTSLRGKKHAARDDTAIERVAEGGERTCLQCGRIFRLEDESGQQQDLSAVQEHGRLEGGRPFPDVRTSMEDDLFPETKPDPKITEGLYELRREMRLRKSVYPRWVINGRLKQEEANRRMNRLQDAIDVLEGLLR